LGVGESDASVYYVADQVPDGGPQRVFVSADTVLERQFVLGSSGMGNPPNSDYSFGFQNESATAAADGGTLFINQRGGVAVIVGLGPPFSRNLYSPDADDIPLRIVDGGALRGFAIRNLPYEIEYVADAANGDSIVVTESEDVWSTSDIRLFYGSPSHMVEATDVIDSPDCCEDLFSFEVNGAKYDADFQISSGALDEGTHLTTPAGNVSLKVRSPKPTNLNGFSFVCTGA